MYLSHKVLAFFTTNGYNLVNSKGEVMSRHKIKKTINKDSVEKIFKDINAIEAKLNQIIKQVNVMGKQLNEKYRLVANLYNKDYENDEEFVSLTDYTSDTLYYCLDPLQNYTALFFVPSKDSATLIPIHFALVPPKEGEKEPSFELQFNPSYTQSTLEQRELQYKDLLLKFSDLKSPIKNDYTDFMEQIFSNPPKTENEDFENIMMEKLFEITKNEQFKVR